MKLYTQQVGKKKIAERLGVSKKMVKQNVDVFIGMKRTRYQLSKLTFRLSPFPVKVLRFSVGLCLLPWQYSILARLTLNGRIFF
jgi:hypothetical protein